MKIKLFYILILSSYVTFSQTKDKKKNIGLSIEIGAGYGTLSHQFDDKTSNNRDTTFQRSELWLQPTARISYHLFTFFFGPNHADITPFVGYYNFGGKSKTNPNGYKDILLFKSLEFGLMTKISRRNKIIISPSFKAQYVFNTEQKYYGTLYQPDSIPRQWVTNHNNSFFKKIAMNVGLNIKYKDKKMTLALEGWYGVSNLNAINIDKSVGVLKVKDNNYRLLIGYDF